MVKGESRYSCVKSKIQKNGEIGVQNVSTFRLQISPFFWNFEKIKNQGNFRMLNRE